jgi:multiple sugar transport system ATP-binding protein
MTLGTKVAVMKDGLIQQFDEPQAIYDNPANMFVAGFIGSPPMNFLPGRLEQRAGKLSLHLEGNGAQSLQIAEAPDGVNAWTGRPIIAGIRPEAIHPGTEGQADLIGVVDVVEPTGPDTMVVVKVGEKSLTARLSPRIRPKPGEPLPLRLEQGALRFFDPATGNAIG